MLPFYYMKGYSIEELEDMLETTKLDRLYEFRYNMLTCGDDPMKDKVALQALHFLSLCQKGLSDYELLKLLTPFQIEELSQMDHKHGDSAESPSSRLDQHKKQQISSLISPIAIIQEKLHDIVAKFDILWIVTSNHLKHFIAKNKLSPEARIKAHSQISKSYEITLRKNLTLLEEKIYHIYKSKDYSGLKQALADIEHFLLLYNPVMKLDLFLYWKFLEMAGYEPVAEYAKSVDAFESRASPPGLDLFKIILQLSRFFKEFADFENSNTPEFEHPKIVNKSTLRASMESLSRARQSAATQTAEEKQKEKLQKDEERRRLRELKEKKDKRHNFFSDLDEGDVSDVSLAGQEFADKDDSMVSVNSFYGEEDMMREDSYDEEGRRKINYLEEIGLIDELKRLGIESDINEFREDARPLMDLSIPSHMVKFRQIHKDLVYEDERLREEYLNNLGRDELVMSSNSLVGDNPQHEPGKEAELELSDPLPVTEDSHKEPVQKKTTEHHSPKNFAMMDPNSSQMQDLLHQLEAEHIKPTKWDPTFYHYKRWIWVMFPWACIRTVRDYPFSYLISRCFQNATKYMSVKEEKILARSSLKIALEYKKSINVLLREEELKKKRIKDEARLNSIREQNNLKRSELVEKGSQDKKETSENTSLLQAYRDDVGSVYKIVKGRIRGGDESSTTMLPQLKNQGKSNLSNDKAAPITAVGTTTAFYTKGFGNHKRGGTSSNAFKNVSMNLQNTTLSLINRDTVQSTVQAKSFRETSIANVSGQGSSTARETRLSNSSRFKQLQGLHQSTLDKFKSKLSTHSGMEGGLGLVNDFSQMRHNLEQKILQKRVETLRNEYDVLAEENNKEQLRLDEFKRLAEASGSVKVKDDHENEVNRLKFLQAKLKKLETEKNEMEIEKERMSLIIDVCGVNNRLNGQWKHALQLTDTNYDRAIAAEEANLAQLRTQARQIQHLIDGYHYVNSHSVHNHTEMMNELNMIRNNQDNVSAIYQNYESAIFEQSVIDEEKLRREEISREAELKRQAEINDISAKNALKRFELELIFLREEFQRLQAATKLSVDPKKSEERKKFSSSLKQFKEDCDRLNTLQLYKESLISKADGLKSRNQFLEMGSIMQSGISLEGYNITEKKAHLKEQRKTLQYKAKKNIKAIEACSHGVDVLNKLNRITKIPGRPLTVSNCFIQGEKIESFLSAYMESIKEKIGHDRWKALMDLHKDPLVIVDGLRVQDKQDMNLFFKSMQKLIPKPRTNFQKKSKSPNDLSVVEKASPKKSTVILNSSSARPSPNAVSFLRISGPLAQRPGK